MNVVHHHIAEYIKNKCDGKYTTAYRSLPRHDNLYQAKTTVKVATMTEICMAEVVVVYTHGDDVDVNLRDATNHTYEWNRLCLSDPNSIPQLEALLISLIAEWERRAEPELL